MPKMTFREAFEKFLQIEDELDLFNQQIGGVYFWERIRLFLYQEILIKAGMIGQPYTGLKRTVMHKIKAAFRVFKNIFVKNPFFAPKSDLLFLGTSRRKLRSDGKWWDIYFDSIIDYLNMSYVNFTFAPINIHPSLIKTKNIRYLNILHLLSLPPRSTTLKREISLTVAERKLLENIRTLFINKFGVQIDLENIVEKNLVLRKIFLPIYRTLLNRVGPKLVFIAGSGGKETFIEACKSMEIPVVELQHGVISKYHLDYSFPGPKRIKRTFPDYLFLFGDFWKTDIEYPISEDRIFSVGYPYFEEEAKQYERLEKKDQIIFISQGTIGKELSKIAAELSRIADFPFKIIYKLHPGEYPQWREKYPWLVNANLQVVDNDEIPLYRLFAESKIQVGVNSTAIYEGLYFGPRTLLLDLPGAKEYMDQLIKEGIARVVSSTEELIAEITKNKIVPQIQRERFFKSNSLYNIKRAVNELLKTAKTDKKS